MHRSREPANVCIHRRAKKLTRDGEVRQREALEVWVLIVGCGDLIAVVIEELPREPRMTIILAYGYIHYAPQPSLNIASRIGLGSVDANSLNVFATRDAAARYRQHRSKKTVSTI